MSETAQLEPSIRLTLQQETFIKEFHLTGNAQQSAIKAGYAESSAHVTASKMLKNAKVLARLDQLRKETDEVYGIRKQDLIDELKAIAFGHIGELLDWTGDEVTIKPKDQLTVTQMKFIDSIQYEKRMEATGETDPETGDDVFAPVYKIKFNTLAKEKREAIKMLGQLTGLWKPEKAASAGGAGDIFNTQNNIVFVAEWGTGVPIGQKSQK